MNNTAIAPTAANSGNLVGSIVSGSASVAIAQTRELAESVAAIQMAKMFPRDLIQTQEDVKRECMRTELAKRAVYTYARRGAVEPITGPSIRLAEVLVRCMGNIDAGWRELEQTPESVKCEAYAWDKERNSRHTVTFSVSKIRHTKSGDYFLTDARDIYEKCANESARRKRACILAIIPGDIVDMAVAQCQETLKATADTSPEGVKKLLDAFKKFNVTKADIERRIQRKIEAILPAQVVDLRNVYNSLRDGMGSKEDYFKGEVVDVDSTATPHSQGGNKIRNALGLKPNASDIAAEPLADAQGSKPQASINPDPDNAVDANSTANSGTLRF